MSSVKGRDESIFQKCINKFENFPYSSGGNYCNATFDGYLCWAPTEAGETAIQNCPPVRLSDTNRFAYRKCGDDGLWLNRKANESSAIGWTNYTPCFPAEVQSLFVKVYDDEEGAQKKFEIAQATRYMEIAGFAISLLALMTSLFIFSYYRSLRNNRTRIHKSLFSAMILQVLTRLTLYIDQALTRNALNDQMIQDNVTTIRGIDNTPYVCEASYVLLEYAGSVMFMWMLVEGLCLNIAVTRNAMRVKISYLTLYILGWGLPVLITTVWATITAWHYQHEHVKKCWYGYNFSPTYWIVQGPRLTIIVVNFMFLLNIMRVLIMKLRQSESSEVKKVRKAVRAALVLLPLLGITNILNMTEAPLDGSVLEFGLWSFSTHFLRSFQGFFIALIYCFLNAEVRLVIKKHYYNCMAMRQSQRQRRDRNFIMNFLFGRNVNRRPRPRHDTGRFEHERGTWIQMRTINQKRDSPTANIESSDTEMVPESSQAPSDQRSRNTGRFEHESGTWTQIGTKNRKRDSPMTNIESSDTEIVPESSQAPNQQGSHDTGRFEHERGTFIQMRTINQKLDSPTANIESSDTEMVPESNQASSQQRRLRNFQGRYSSHIKIPGTPVPDRVQFRPVIRGAIMKPMAACDEMAIPEIFEPCRIVHGGKLQPLFKKPEVARDLMAIPEIFEQCRVVRGEKLQPLFKKPEVDRDEMAIPEIFEKCRIVRGEKLQPLFKEPEVARDETPAPVTFQKCRVVHRVKLQPLILKPCVSYDTPIPESCQSCSAMTVVQRQPLLKEPYLLTQEIVTDTEYDEDSENVQYTAPKNVTTSSDDDTSSEDTDTITNKRKSVIMKKNAMSTVVNIDYNTRHGETTTVIKHTADGEEENKEY